MALTYDGTLRRRRTAWSAKRTLGLVTASSLLLWVSLAVLLFVVLQVAG